MLTNLNRLSIHNLDLVGNVREKIGGFFTFWTVTIMPANLESSLASYFFHVFVHKLLPLFVHILHLIQVVTQGNCGDYRLVFNFLFGVYKKLVKIFIEMVLNLIFTFIFPDFGNPIFDLFLDLVGHKLLVLILDELAFGVIFIDEKRDVLDEYRKVVLCFLALIQNISDPILPKSANEEIAKRYGYHHNVENVNYLDHRDILRCVLVVT